MIDKENLNYSLRNLEKNKTRSFLTVISVLIGIATIFIFLSFGLGLYNYINSFTSGTSADKITIQLKGSTVAGTDSPSNLTDSDLNAVKKTAGVYAVQGAYTSVGKVKKDNQIKYVFLFATDPEKSLVIELSNLEIEKGRQLSNNDRGKVVLGYNYLVPNKIFEKPFELNQRIEINGKYFTIVGFFKKVGNPQDDSNIYINNKYLEEAFPNDTKSYSMIVARVDKTKIDKVVDDVTKNLRESRGLEKGKEDFSVSSFEELLNSYTSSLNIVIGFIILIALISVVVSAINTANTMITSVLERTKEIGVMKSIGARNSEIFKLFLLESGILGLIAGILGVTLGFIFTTIAKSILLNLGWSFLAPYYSPWVFLGCIAFAVITGAISGIIPAMNAAKTNPVKALRYE